MKRTSSKKELKREKEEQETIVYLATHQSTITFGPLWVGVTADLDQRSALHFGGSAKPLAAWKWKSMRDKITFIPLCTLPYADALKLEAELIALLRPICPNLQNVADGPSCTGVKRPRGPRVNPNGILITFPNGKTKKFESQEKAAKFFGVCPATISHAARGFTRNFWGKKPGKKYRFTVAYIAQKAA
jgi:hypothetical protein